MEKLEEVCWSSGIMRFRLGGSRKTQQFYTERGLVESFSTDQNESFGSFRAN
ncbi:unnamed protein product [Dovyalis caffra]|uniref:Uncharacterized protein n=1 Tax=Dovyalis caffra TaxID=77055 RepID=A0AAV1RHC2_9ROSI|nr:unnamed protein product [Dovyalis caffra]